MKKNIKNTIKKSIPILLGINIAMGSAIVPTNFNTNIVYADRGAVVDGSISVVGIAANVLDKFWPLIEREINNNEIYHGILNVEYISYIPPKFLKDKFSISCFDGTNPKASGLNYKVRVYSENTPETYRDFTVKHNQNLEISTDNVNGKIFEFYTEGSSEPFERFYLPNTKQNKLYGIALGVNKNIHYLQREDGRVYNYTLLQSLCLKHYKFPDKADDHYDAWEKIEEERGRDYLDERHKFMLDHCLMKAKKAYKEDISSAGYIDDNSILRLLEKWKSKKNEYKIDLPHTIEAESFKSKSPHLKNYTYSNGEGGLNFSHENFFAGYYVPIPKDGYYQFEFKYFKHYGEKSLVMIDEESNEILTEVQMTGEKEENQTKKSEPIMMKEGVHKIVIKTPKYGIDFDKFKYDFVGDEDLINSKRNAENLVDELSQNLRNCETIADIEVWLKDAEIKKQSIINSKNRGTNIDTNNPFIKKIDECIEELDRYIETALKRAIYIRSAERINREVSNFSEKLKQCETIEQLESWLEEVVKWKNSREKSIKAAKIPSEEASKKKIDECMEKIYNEIKTVESRLKSKKILIRTEPYVNRVVSDLSNKLKNCKTKEEVEAWLKEAVAKRKDFESQIKGAIHIEQNDSLMKEINKHIEKLDSKIDTAKSKLNSK